MSAPTTGDFWVVENYEGRRSVAQFDYNLYAQPQSCWFVPGSSVRVGETSFRAIRKIDLEAAE